MPSWLRASLCILSSLVSSCVVVGGYDFGSYHAAAPDADASTSNDSGSCIPMTCEELHAECGKVPDGCSGVLDCGGCEVGICGGGGRDKGGGRPGAPRN